MALNRPSIPPALSELPKPLLQRRAVRAALALTLGVAAGGGYWVRETLTSIDMFKRHADTAHLLHTTFPNFDTSAVQNTCRTTLEPPSHPMNLVYSEDDATRAHQELTSAQIRADLNGLRALTTAIALGTDTWFVPHLPSIKRHALCYRDTAAYLTAQLPR